MVNLKYYLKEKILYVRKMGEKAIEIEKINWPLWIITIFVITILTFLGQAAISVTGMPFACTFNLAASGWPFVIPLPLLLMLIFTYIPTYMGRKVRITTIAYLFIITYIIACVNWPMGIFPVGYASRAWKSEPAIREAMSKLWWMPPESVVAPVWGRGGPVDWAAWTPAMLWFFLNNFIALLMGSAMVTMLRRQWIDIEKVPFPFVTATWETIRCLHLKEVERRKPFLIGLIVGFLFYLQVTLTILLPWWPDVLGWRVLNISPAGCINIVPGSGLWPIANQVVAFMKGSMQLIAYAFAFLMPLDILFSAWFLWVIFMILAQVAYVMGYYTGALDYSGCCRVLLGPWERSPVWGPPLNWGWMSMTGGMLAFTVMMLWYSKAHLVEVVKAALGKPSPTIKEAEAKEPISYKMAFIQLIIGCILFIAFLASQQVDFVLGVITFIFLGFIYLLANTYSVGLTGIYYGKERSKWSMWPVHLIYSKHPGTYTPGWCAAGLLLTHAVNDHGFYWYPFPVITLAGFKFADLANIHPKNLYKMMFVAFLIIQPIACVFQVWMPYQFAGFIRTCMSGWECDYLGNAYNTVPPTNELIGPIISGFIITLLLFLLRARFIWWPIHPLGFLISGAAWVVWTGVWTCFLVAWVAKWLLLRIGGSKAYEGYGVPFVSGILAGYAVMNVVGVIAGLMRLVRPY